MDEIIIEGVRCFHERQSAPLRPVTLLVGENSTGKTTLLALARIAWDLCQGRPLDFNEEPFLLGAYDQVASYRGGRGGRARSFTVGAGLRLGRALGRARVQLHSDVIVVTGRFASKESQPRLQEWVLDAHPFRLEVQYGEKHEHPVFTVTTPGGRLAVTDVVFFERFRVHDLLRFLHYAVSEKTRAQDLRPLTTEGKVSQAELSFLVGLAYRLSQSLAYRPYAFAPIRTRPQRTYDPIKDIPVPEGAHVPVILARTFSSGPEAWAKLARPLDSFGEASGLFTDVRVRRMGPKESGPFQISVKISGPERNLVDVGYGVSQVLPIIVDSLRAPEGSTFLLQQPEVHLHPRAQAELASFLALQAKQRRHRFLIETHSDYLVDRVRMDVREGRQLVPDDVSILYFDRQDGGVAIRPLHLDNLGNIVGAPPGYRQFFLNEEKRLLGG